MARGKRITDFLRWTGRTQSNQPLTVQIDEELVAPLEARVDELEDDVEQLQASFASGVVHGVDVELAGGLCGEFVIRGVFPDDQVGAPVIVTLSGDVEIALVVFAGVVVDRGRLRVRYVSSSPAPRRSRVNFIIGAVE